MLHMPEQIRVELSDGANHTTPDDSFIPNTTRLFRKNANIPDGATVVAENTDRGTTVRILDCAASVGAEAYSILSVMMHSGLDHMIELTGLDPEERNLDALVAGNYRTKIKPAHSFYDLEVDRSRIKEIQEMGFEAELVIRNPSIGHFKEFESRIEIGTEALRSRYSILPLLGVMADVPKVLPEKEFHWVLANNIFYWQTPEEATASLLASASVVTEGGVFSMSSTNYDYMREDAETIALVPFDTWQDEAIENLQSLGFVSACEAGYGVDMRPYQRPTVFVRE